ncbi:30S ribosomal protein S17 [Patescibacteria group bacterium]|nr:30S ribosomal protein S17 [Patescibacteria group bacterium]MBU1472296.1 30S ribosomal protein S17 [Patescibacteria group bacterium]MBU2460453.1 30S ribosomal protein S17 [Patescibacteria group bacterium]MBU2543988.1 30S ribosomal protein S17 [Patescibacteria group bacterium]
MKRINRKTYEGKVVSVKTQNTVIVAVAHTIRHPLYKKSMRITKRFPVHYEKIELHVGDQVKIIETRPISKTKHFLILTKS